MTLNEICSKVKGKRKGFTLSTGHMNESERALLIRMIQATGTSVRVEDVMYRSTRVTVC
jgi:hypothetical protein